MAVTDRATREWALRGASARLMEIEQERAAILRVFPELRRTTARTPVTPGGQRARPKATPALRRKLSAGMRKYWARRKAAAAART
jgi:hypothetical protein